MWNAFAAAYEKIGCGLAMANRWTDAPAQIILFFALALFTGIPAAHIAVAYFVSPFAAPLVTLACYLYYQYVFLITPPADTEKFLEFKVCAARAFWCHLGHAPLLHGARTTLACAAATPAPSSTAAAASPCTTPIPICRSREGSPPRTVPWSARPRCW